MNSFRKTQLSFLFVTVSMTFHFGFMTHQQYLLIKATFDKCHSFGTSHNNSISASKPTISISKRKKGHDKMDLFP